MSNSYSLFNISDSTPGLSSPKENWTILTLFNQQRQAERTLLKKQNSTGTRGPGRPRLIAAEGSVAETLTADDEVLIEIILFIYIYSP